MKYRAEIDGLRAVAVVPVILFHAGLEAFSGGFVGVDVFFVLSGYLITTIIIDEMDQGRFNLPNFYERRAKRSTGGMAIISLPRARNISARACRRISCMPTEARRTRAPGPNALREVWRMA